MGEGKGEEINNGEGRGEVRSKAMLCLPRWIEGWRICAEDSHISIPPSLGQAEGEWQHCREGTGADPSEGQLRCRRQGTHSAGSS